MTLELARTKTDTFAFAREWFLEMIKEIRKRISCRKEDWTDHRVKRGIFGLQLISDEELREFHDMCGFMMRQAEFEIDRRGMKADKR